MPIADQPRTVPWVLLDSNALWSDPYFEGAAAQALRDESTAGHVRLAIPEVVLIECDAKHRREVKRARDQYEKARERLGRLRASQGNEDFRPLRSYRREVEEIVQEVGGEILPIPQVPHGRLVEKAANRRRPFDENGNGYRDALVWETVLALLDRTPAPVMLISRDWRAFSRTSDTAELAPELAKELRDRNQGRRAQVYFDLKSVMAELPQVREVLSLWRHKIAENPQLRDALISALMKITAEDATRFIAIDDPAFRNARFVDFTNPRNLQVEEAWVTHTGSVLLDVDLNMDYRLEFETLARPTPMPQAGPYQWNLRETSRTAALTFEVVQHEPETDPTNFVGRLTGFSDPGSWVFAGPVE